MTARRSFALALALVLVLGLFEHRASAHIVSNGVGTQTWIDVRPRKIHVRFNLGFSNLLGLGELKRADKNKDNVIDASEVSVYLDELAPRVLPSLRLHLDGKPLELRVLSHSAQGMRGEIMTVAFDTFFECEAVLPARIAAGPHDLTYYEGSYKNETAQQLLYVITDRISDFRELRIEQQERGTMTERPGATELMGRDVTIHFDYRPAALERDRAEELLEPALSGLHDTVNVLATTVARGSEADFATTAVGNLRFGGPRDGPALLETLGPGFEVSAPTAVERDGSKPAASTPAQPVTTSRLRTEEDEETQNMLTEARKPFTIASLLLFLLWGAIHAKGPGHGKTMVAAYLLGTNGRMWDAIRLGLIVTFTHTFTLYTFGLGLVYLVDRLRLTEASQQQVSNRATFLLSLGSGVALAIYGVGLAWRRKVALDKGVQPAHGHPHAHDHAHEHDHSHAPVPTALAAPTSGKRLGLVTSAPVEVPAPDHGHSHGEHSHSHGEHSHSHGGHSHSHEGMSEDEHAALHAREASTQITSFKDLLTLGLSSGIVPCPAGITLIVYMLGHSDPGKTTLRTFLYLNAFSLGLGSVLVAIAVTMVLSRRYLQNALTARRRQLLTRIPIYSALLIALLGCGTMYEAFDPLYAKLRARIFRAPGVSVAK